MPRVVVMTDAEVDDRCSMVHFLLYSNDMEVAAIIQSNSCYQRHGWSSEPWLAKQLDAYEQVYPNLKVHDPNYPTPDYLRSVVFIGDENPDHVQLDGSTTRHLLPGTEPVIDPTDWPDTPGSDRIVELLTDDDPRPVYLQAWGGMNTAAKALQKIKAQYPEKYEAACRKAVLYCIWYQDAGGPYIERNHPGVTILLSHHFSGSWDYGTMTSSDNVVREYMHNGKNPLGACYVQPLISEGDSPSFLYSINNGLRSYEDPTYGGWGGRFYKVDGYEKVYRDTGFGELREWLENCMHDFETRLSWCYTPRREDANHAPEVTLNAQERAVWEETCKMGFPKYSWYGFRYMDQHGFVATYSGCCAMDPAYFSHDFWEKPGYEGYEADSLLKANHIQQEGVILGFYDQEMCEKMQLVSPADDAGEGNADRATRNMGANNGQPRALALNTVFPDVFFMIGDLIIKSGEAKGQTLQMHGVHDNLAILSTVCPASTIAKLKVGDTVMVDNSRALAALYMHRHFIPGPEYYAWNQFRDAQGNPIPPQRPMLLGPIFTQGAGGCLPTGNINGKMILLESLWDREAYPWQADWYRNNIIKNKGQQFCDENFRIWFTDRCTHGGVDDATQVINYMPIIQQALLDVADWAEKGIEPSPTTTYRVEDSQVIIPADATDRGGVQPSVDLTIEGKKRYETKVGQEVMVHVGPDVLHSLRNIDMAQVEA